MERHRTEPEFHIIMIRVNVVHRVQAHYSANWCATNYVNIEAYDFYMRKNITWIKHMKQDSYQKIPLILFDDGTWQYKENLKNRVTKILGKEVPPRDYPEKYKEEWNRLQDQIQWDDHYPFNKDNVRNFAEFCLQSGGFQIS